MALEQHAIPTEVTTYEFRLVGDMTLKQFGWLAGGILLAILTYMAIPIFIIKWPLVIMFAFGGAAIAFVPYEGRTLDRWIIAFFKAVYMPTEFVWHKERRTPDYFQTVKRLPDFKPQSNLTTLEQTKLQTFVDNLPMMAATSVSDTAEQQQLAQINSLFGPQEYQLTPQPTQDSNTQQLIDPGQLASPLKSSLPTPITDTMDQPPQYIDFSEPTEIPPNNPPGRIISQFTESQTPNTNTLLGPEQPSQPSADLENELTQIAQQLPIEQSDTQTSGDQSRFSEPTDYEPQLQSAMAAATQELPQPDALDQILPQTPQADTNITTNLPADIVSGQVLDQNQQPVHQAIVEIIDHRGFPARALKTDINGHFQIATPVVPGPYTLKVEKSNLHFEPINFQANGNSLAPFHVIATPQPTT